MGWLKGRLTWNSLAEGREQASKFSCKFIETSAKQRLNVDDAFSQLVREIRKYNKEQAAGRPGAPSAGGNTPGAFTQHDSDEGAGCCGGCVVL